MTAKIHVGTSGYSFKDWLGTVYPASMKSGEMLSYYARMFDCVEINSTYYRVPSPFMFINMLKKVPTDFTFVVKVPKEMTHEREKFESVVLPFVDGILPLFEAKQLGGLLAQFPYSFKAVASSLEHLKKVSEVFSGHGIPLNVEFRHSSWYSDDVYKNLEELGLGFVNVDLPNLENLPGPSNITTSDVAYYRLHGRNAKMWWKHPTPSHRYDYLYNDEQLEEWAARIEEAAEKTKVCYIFNNNCHLGKSIPNALHLRKRLNVPKPTLPPGVEAEMFESTVDERIGQLIARIKAASEKEEEA